MPPEPEKHGSPGRPRADSASTRFKRFIRRAILSRLERRPGEADGSKGARDHVFTL